MSNIPNTITQALLKTLWAGDISRLTNIVRIAIKAQGIIGLGDVEPKHALNALSELQQAMLRETLPAADIAEHLVTSLQAVERLRKQTDSLAEWFHKGTASLNSIMTLSSKNDQYRFGPVDLWNESVINLRKSYDTELHHAIAYLSNFRRALLSMFIGIVVLFTLWPSKTQWPVTFSLTFGITGVILFLALRRRSRATSHKRVRRIRRRMTAAVIMSACVVIFCICLLAMSKHSWIDSDWPPETGGFRRGDTNIVKVEHVKPGMMASVSEIIMPRSSFKVSVKGMKHDVLASAIYEPYEILSLGKFRIQLQDSYATYGIMEELKKIGIMNVKSGVASQPFDPSRLPPYDQGKVALPQIALVISNNSMRIAQKVVAWIFTSPIRRALGIKDSGRIELGDIPAGHAVLIVLNIDPEAIEIDFDAPFNANLKRNELSVLLQEGESRNVVRRPYYSDSDLTLIPSPWKSVAAPSLVELFPSFLSSTEAKRNSSWQRRVFWNSWRNLLRKETPRAIDPLRTAKHFGPDIIFRLASESTQELRSQVRNKYIIYPDSGERMLEIGFDNEFPVKTHGIVRILSNEGEEIVTLKLEIVLN